LTAVALQKLLGDINIIIKNLQLTWRYRLRFKQSTV